MRYMVGHLIGVFWRGKVCCQHPVQPARLSVHPSHGEIFMDFSKRTIDYLSGLRQEITRLERDILKLKVLERSLEQYLGDPVSSPLPDTGPVPPPNLFHKDAPYAENPVSLEKRGEKRSIRDLPVGELAVRILASENRSFDLDELAGRIREEFGEIRSADLKNAIRVSLIRRQDRVIREKRGVYRLKNDIRDTD
jgi:hypothetical protein